jgi:signal transduction histidine kinase
MTASSLHRRLLLAGAALILLALGAATVGLTLLFQHHVERRLNEELKIDLDQLIAGLGLSPSGELASVTPPADPRFERPLSGLYWQIVVEPAKRTLTSRSLWDTELKLPPTGGPDDAIAYDRVPGPSGGTVYLAQRHIVLPASLKGGEIRAAVALDAAEISAAVKRFAYELALFLSVIAALLIAAAWAQVRIGLQPLAAVRDRLSAIRSGASRRLGSAFPAEVQPLAGEIDALLDARDRELAKARSRASDLAHGLKTPLQVLEGEVRRLRAAGSDAAADEIENVANTMTRHVERHLARARLATVEKRATANVKTVVERVVRVVRRSPHGERLAWIVDVPPALAARIDADDLAEALGNLVENAARHARARVRLSGRADAERAVLTVEDDGAGIPAERIDEALRRGARLDMASPGTGLGLAIAADIAEAWDGHLELKNGAPGLRAVMRFPIALKA